MNQPQSELSQAFGGFKMAGYEGGGGGIVNKRQADEDINNLVSSMNNTIGVASLVYSHYVSQIGDIVNNIDNKDSEEAGEKVTGLFQQVYALESWLKNAREELMSIESFARSQENGLQGRPQGKRVGENIEHDENRRRVNEKDVEITSWEKPTKKRKVE